MLEISDPNMWLGNNLVTHHIRYDLAMIDHRKPAFVALAIAACCLAACGAPKAAPAVTSAPSASATADPAAAYRTLANRGAGPRVEELTVREGRQLAATWCSDLATTGRAKAGAAINAEASQFDAIQVMLFAIDEVCPELRPKVES